MAEITATKGALAEAMKQLMSERSFAKINISDICDKCGMSRKSFYYHFKDKYDLMNWIFYADFITLISSRSFADGWELSQAVCELFYESQGFYRCAFRTEGQNSFKEYLAESMGPILDFLFDDVWREIHSYKLAGRMFCDLYIITVSNWIFSGCKVPPAELISSVKEVIKKLAESL